MIIFAVRLAKKPRQPKINGEGNFNAFNNNRFHLEGSDVHFKISGSVNGKIRTQGAG